MATLLGVLNTIGPRDELVSKLIVPQSEEPPKVIQSGGRNYYRAFTIAEYITYSGMDYENMQEMPENRDFVFDSFGVQFENYFPDDLSGKSRIVLPSQPDEDLVTIVLGKRPTWKHDKEDGIDDSVYLCIGSGDRKPARIHALRGNVEVLTPILYTLIDGNIQILVPEKLSYAVPQPPSQK